ncbi:DegV family protein [Tenuibacillus multivorans]|uniref:EDD domain protein, DegV family n=1 Tax=Tenuibacillus multivorans TaxID=237069 RepID=A0A1H0B9S7_9BACI|nr:DegV family protein [Tenuibacillus multivorans]GEL78764.1 DegV family protein [Tenuibacillus multivorans]SDN42400.1 EDD domain protein, DegV family [Tenuibacillus multivorans]
MSFQLMVDGGADLPKELIEKFNVKIVPLNIHFANEEYKAGVDLSTEEFYKKMKATDELPKTSASSPNDFYNAFKEINPDIPILLLSLTKNLSATYQNAELGKNMLLDEEPDRIIEIVNTKTASCGVALLLNEAVKLKLKEVNFHEIVNHVKASVERTATLFSLKTVENLIKGGRLDKVRGAIAKTLNIKLLMKASDEGDIEVTEKVRGEKKALRRLVEQIGDYTKSLEGKTIALAHSNCEEKAKKVLASIKEKYNPSEELLVEMGPLIATHAGEGGLVISFLEDKK